MVPDIDRKSIDEIMVVDRETGVRDGDR
jgi:hypothetical protein